MNFKNEIPSWDDIRLFLAVARGGGLKGAADATGISAATLGRHVLRLERAIGGDLFEKRQTGYRLTAMGDEFYEYARQFEDQAAALERWRQGRTGTRTLRIAAGSWTAWYVTSHLAALRQACPDVPIELVTGAGFVDLLRREANIGIRNRRPQQPGLAGRRMASVAFAIYGAPVHTAVAGGLDGWADYAVLPWIGAANVDTRMGANQTPSAKWMQENVGAAFSFAATDVRLLLDAAVAGAGVCLLPCFVGDSTGGLVRLSAEVEPLRHDQWLVSHEEDRHFPAVRRMLDALAAIFTTHAPLFAGTAAGLKKSS